MTHKWNLQAPPLEVWTKRCEVAALLQANPFQVVNTIRAIRVWGIKYLVVSEDYLGPNQWWWTITHLPTGCRVIRISLQFKNDAIKVLRILAKMPVDWASSDPQTIREQMPTNELHTLEQAILKQLSSKKVEGERI